MVRRLSWCAVGRPTARKTRERLSSWPSTSPYSTTTVGVEATAGIRRRMRSSARSRTSMPLSPQLVDRHLCTVIPPVRLWPSRQRRAAWRGDAVEYYMANVVGLPHEFVAEAKKAPWWPAQEALAHTLAYDATIMGDYSLPTERAATVMVPTLVIDGGASFPWIGKTAQAIADIIPHAQRRSLEGQTHNVAAEAITPVLEEFFADRNKSRGSVTS